MASEILDVLAYVSSSRQRRDGRHAETRLPFRLTHRMPVFHGLTDTKFDPQVLCDNCTGIRVAAGR